MDYLKSGNDSHLVVGSEVVKMESGSNTGLVALITQISKALHRRTSEELLGMRLKQFLLLGYVRDHGNGGFSPQESVNAPPVIANSAGLRLNQPPGGRASVKPRCRVEPPRDQVASPPAGRRRARSGQEM